MDRESLNICRKCHKKRFAVEIEEILSIKINEVILCTQLQVCE